ncbi:Uncharacterised protein family UPF0646 [Phaffia rhodozyma]|uniref:Uncharacterized protein family UPF0646 n=1 Tax=Phaffia rhodozyma TaxID=264483 RepID=A0A0F7SX65_PHARH|nr:Uncharacterised protein family UPF0646 [Phaffia rhodozyma]
MDISTSPQADVDMSVETVDVPEETMIPLDSDQGEHVEEIDMIGTEEADEFLDDLLSDPMADRTEVSETVADGLGFLKEEQPVETVPEIDFISRASSPKPDSLAITGSVIEDTTPVQSLGLAPQSSPVGDEPAALTLPIETLPTGDGIDPIEVHSPDGSGTKIAVLDNGHLPSSEQDASSLPLAEHKPESTDDVEKSTEDTTHNEHEQEQATEAIDLHREENPEDYGSPQIVFHSEHEIASSDIEDHDPNDEEDDEEDGSESTFFPTIISYQPRSSTPSSAPILMKSYSLFNPIPSSSSDHQDGIEALDTPALPVLLSSNSSLFEAPLLELFDALREEAAFSTDGRLLSIDDGGGNNEWLLAHEDEKVGIVIGEDNVWASQTSLSDLARLHYECCDLPPPLRLVLRAGQPRFMLRFQKIQAIRQEMDEEEINSEDHEDDDGEEDEDNVIVLSGDHDEIEGDADETDVNLQPDPEIEEDELASDQDEVIKVEIVGAGEDEDDQDDEDRLDDHNDSSPKTENDRFATPTLLNDAEEEDELTATVGVGTGDESGIVEDTKLIITANADIEVPLSAEVVETSDGDVDEAAAVDQTGTEDVVQYETALAEEHDQESELPDETEAEKDLARKVEMEAALATGSVDAVEQIPIPEVFAHAPEVEEEEDSELQEQEAEKESLSNVPEIIVEPETDDFVEGAAIAEATTRLQPPTAPVLESRNSLTTDTALNDLYADSPLLSPVADTTPVTDLDGIDHELSDALEREGSDAESELLIIESEPGGYDEFEDELAEEGEDEEVGKRRFDEVGDKEEFDEGAKEESEDTSRDLKRLRSD